MKCLLRSFGTAYLYIAAFAMSACSDSSRSTVVVPADSAIGAYVLKSVDGVAVPGTSGGTYWQDGSLAINEDKTFVQALHFSATPNGSVVLSGVNGTWERSSAT